jgi:hypothetical protein
MSFNIQAEKMEPAIIKGGQHTDSRGTLTFNNGFDASLVKRFYTIQNTEKDFIRGWQGHKIEQRWFSAIHGAFEIRLIKIDDWETPSAVSDILTFRLDSATFDILHVSQGYASAIRSLTHDAKLLAMSDYLAGEVKDEYRFELNYFDHINRK